MSMCEQKISSIYFENREEPIQFHYTQYTEMLKRTDHKIMNVMKLALACTIG